MSVSSTLRFNPGIAFAAASLLAGAMLGLSVNRMARGAVAQ